MIKLSFAVSDFRHEISETVFVKCEYKAYNQNTMRSIKDKKNFEMKKCDQCEYKAHPRTIHDHKLRVHEGKLNVCGLCDKIYARKYTLNMHISITHDGNKAK